MPDTLSVQDWLVLIEKPKLSNRYYATVALLVAQEMFEFYDFFLVGYLVSVLAPGWKLTYGQSAVMLLSSGLGAIVGSLVGGRVADTIGRKVAAGSHAALILDGAGYHIAAALTIPENVTLVRLPPYAPELNPIENVWEYLRGNKLAITVFDDYDDIVDKTCDAWNFFEQDPNRIASITTRTWATVNI